MSLQDLLVRLKCLTVFGSDESRGMAEFKGNGDGDFETQFKLVPRVTISDNTSEVFCVRFSPDGKFLAVSVKPFLFVLILFHHRLAVGTVEFVSSMFLTGKLHTHSRVGQILPYQPRQSDFVP
jgi:hypothetical protein